MALYSRATRRLRTVLWSGTVAAIGCLRIVEPASAEPVTDLLTRLPGLEKLAEVPMPPAVGRLLQRFGIESRGETLLGRVHPGFRPMPAPDAESVALMERARSEDVAFDGATPLFDEKSIELGLWHSSSFLDTYGTALFLAAPYDSQRIPVILVHGINGSPRDFRALVSRLGDSPYQPVLFFYPSGMPLGEASRELGLRLQEFVLRHDVERFAVIGHSMGGLVAKGMLDEFDVPKVLPAWRLFVSISSPWGGVDAAKHSGQIPRHPPSWDDMPPTSAFLGRINRTPFPAEIPFYVFFGARGGPSLFGQGSGDGVLSLDGSVDAPVTRSARDVVGFYEDHNSILAAPRMHQRLAAVLEEVLPPGTEVAEAR
jgi:pimeloyl-ACP methyl ester carboxylesterase